MNVSIIKFIDENFSTLRDHVERSGSTTIPTTPPTSTNTTIGQIVHISTNPLYGSRALFRVFPGQNRLFSFVVYLMEFRQRIGTDFARNSLSRNFVRLTWAIMFIYVCVCVSICVYVCLKPQAIVAHCDIIYRLYVYLSLRFYVSCLFATYFFRSETDRKKSNIIRVFSFCCWKTSAKYKLLNIDFNLKLK